MTGHVRGAGRTAAVLTVTVAAALIGVAPQAVADEKPAAPAAPSAENRAAAHKAAAAPDTLDTLARFFAREGAVTRAAAEPRIDGAAVPVYTLAPEFVAGREGAPVAHLEYLASRAVSSDGQKASLWSVPQGGSWQVVNISTGDDETRYASEGARRLPGGTVFREPQIDAWYVQRHARVLPLDEDAVKAVGARGTTLAAYQDRVEKAYADKLPGSAYAKKGKAGGYASEANPQAQTQPQSQQQQQQQQQSLADDAAPTASSGESSPAVPSAVLAAGLVTLALGVTVLGLRRRTRSGG
ncbi:hypothetical protein [Streptomyces sp. H27-C3]|uniref:hypothetical protein n=1 Tax=Streptomyces sp. H27-C3 TaxID=3046305 RepID=UPI0024B8A304|nr:hypothetical protein [Streptomyces sp. H27-C3]MDJ0461735.1 hypothetical protein [Streptomyces sp. H27-C3]